MIDHHIHIFQSQIGEGVEIREFCTIRNSSLDDNCRVYERVSIKKSSIGKGSDINVGTYIENASVAEEVQIGPNCSIVGVTHEFSKEGINHQDKFERIFIGKGSWIGASCVILPGVTIGENVVIAAGAVVNRDIPNSHVYMGIPLCFRLKLILK